MTSKRDKGNVSLDAQLIPMKPPTEPILVWAFSVAPKELQAVSTNGGDEDWLVEVPPNYQTDLWGCHGVPRWVESLDVMLEPKMYDHPTKPGWKIIIGSHA